MVYLNLNFQECTTIFEHCLTKVKTRSQELRLSIDPKLPVKALFHSMLENFDFCRHEVIFVSSCFCFLCFSDFVAFLAVFVVGFLRNW